MVAFLTSKAYPISTASKDAYLTTDKELLDHDLNRSSNVIDDEKLHTVIEENSKPSININF